MNPYLFRRGEDITVELDAPEDNISVVTSIEAFLRLQRNQTLAQGDPAPIPLTVIPRAASPAYPNGWSLTLPAAQSSLLIPNNIYVIDAKITRGTSIDITDQSLFIKITESAGSPQ